MRNHDAYREACQKKAMEDLFERPSKPIHIELQSQYLDNLSYKDVRNISRNMHIARSSQLLPLLTDNKETHEALSAVQVLTNSKKFCSLLILKKIYCDVFLQNQLRCAN
jgi:hypothetical protein